MFESYDVHIRPSENLSNTQIHKDMMTPKAYQMRQAK
jgi:hypothetical protein